jgi:hypothetical protein
MLHASVAPAYTPPRLARPTPLRRAFHTIVAFDLTLPGLSSSGPRQKLLHALGDKVRVQVVATDRGHDCITLHVEVPSCGFDDVVDAVTANFSQATLGRATTISVRR